MSYSYEWIAAQDVDIDVKTSLEAIEDAGLESGAATDGNIAVAIRTTGNSDGAIIEGSYEDVLLVCEQIVNAVRVHQDVHTVPKFSTPEEADAWMERHAALIASQKKIEQEEF